MSEIQDWEVIAANNNDAAPDGWPEGMNYSQVNDSAREGMAVIARWYKDTNGTLTTAGTGNAYTIASPNRTISAYAAGQTFVFKADRANTGNVTLNVSGLGAKAVLDPEGNQLASGAMSANGLYFVIYDGTRFQLIGTQPADPQTATNTTNIATKIGQVLTTVVTASDAAWTPNANTKSIEITAVGGGGGGGGVDGQGSGTSAPASGGGAGGCAILTTNTIPTSLNITIGTGGTGGAAGNNDGNNGVATTVVSTPAGININAGGGVKGLGVTAGAGSGTYAGGNGGTTTGGDINLTGGNGGTGRYTGGSNTSFGDGGGAYFGGDVHGTNNSAGFDATNYGNGGSGAAVGTNTTNYAGGDGADGVVIIKEYVGG